MTNINNDTMKRLLEKIINKTLETKEFSKIRKVDVYYVFGSKVKAAFCDWVYGMKIYSKGPTDNFTITSLQRKIQMNVDKVLKVKVCCTDVQKDLS